jgi:hypothetical protein
MANEWIENLADEVKLKGREAAESYDRDQHRAGIVAVEGKVFFTSLVQCLEQFVSEIRSQLQGSAVSCETSITKDGPTRVKLSRSRFPWFDATLHHAGSDLTLDYAQGRGVAGEESLIASVDRQVIQFLFVVDAHDRLSAREAFGEDPREFSKPEELARYMVELLFKV